ncbi:MAG: mandelate racemase/muconate lactonizing enzyme family protein [Lachnospiraceae bacterium]|nr:mandelate racemase/muconate lactonizing enzyme family protein [Lachnospiraceae bacterium]
MKITDIETIIVRQPDGITLIGDGTQDTVVIKVHTDEGITGVAEVDSAPFVVKAIIEMPASHTACQGLRDLVVGEDPFDVEKIWNKMYEFAYYHGRAAAVIHAMSGIDNAIWDIMGKAVGKPVHKLLGGAYRTEIPAYISILMPDTPDEVKRLVDYHMKEDYLGIKFGWGGLGHDFKKDCELVRTAREALGPDKKLMIDIAMEWTDYKVALKNCKAFEDYDVFWVEEPFRVERHRDFARLRSAVNLNITAGEELFHFDEFKQYIDEGCVDILQPDISRCGGLTVARKIRDYAYNAGIPIVPHNFKSGLLLSATMQYIATLPNALFLEYCGQETVLSRNLITEPINVHNGMVTIPDTPGMGVELDEETLNKYRVG